MANKPQHHRQPPTHNNMGKTASGFLGANLLQIFVIILCGCAYLANPRTITDSSPLDNLIIRPLFHKFRNLTFGIVGPTSLLKRTGKFYQKPLRRFPCDTSLGRSHESPTSVHTLRPGEIMVVLSLSQLLLDCPDQYKLWLPNELYTLGILVFDLCNQVTGTPSLSFNSIYTRVPPMPW